MRWADNGPQRPPADLTGLGMNDNTFSSDLLALRNTNTAE